MTAVGWAVGIRRYDRAMVLLEREPMLALLGERLAEMRGGRGRLVLISGEAGLGKTALLDAFTRGLPRGTQVLRGACDPVVPGRAFAPLIDMAAQLRDGLRTALASADRDRVFEQFLAILRAHSPGCVAIFEDLHWADSATLDLLRVVGRRLPTIPVLLVGTYQGHEVVGEHPLRLTLGDLPAHLVSEVEIPPLTVAAVRTLVAGTGLDPAELHGATGGNPFFVTEVIAAGDRTLPSTVRDAVLTRVARLSQEARQVIRAAAVLGPRVEPQLIVAVAAGPAASAGLQECLRRGMLQEQAGVISFRHEIARRAVLDAMAPAERAGLNAVALHHLRSTVTHADVVRLAQHAIESGDGEEIVSLAPRAAEQAAGLGAHGEAADYLAAALSFPSAVNDRTRAELLERHACECSLADRVAAARSAQQEALAIWRRLDDPLREGDGLRALSGYMWLGGEGERARETVESAVGVLEPIVPHGHEMALALATVAQRRLVAAQDDEAAATWARRGLDLAERIGDEPVAIHALTTLAVAEIYQGVPGGWDRLEGALLRARAGGLSDAIARALINLVEAARDFRRYDLADRYVDEAGSFLGDHGFDLYRRLLGSRIAEIALERGRWGLAERQALSLLDERAQSNQVRVRALVVLGRLRARRGEPGAWAALDEAMAIVGPGELQEICPLHAARAEAAWFGGDLVRAGDEAVAGLDVGIRVEAELQQGELAFWAWRAGRIERLPEGGERGYVLHAAGRFREAALAWADIGCPYQQAAALADSEMEADLREALAMLHALGARALGRRVSHRLRGMGARRIPRGPRPSTRSNPAGLSTRELEILVLIREGARNSDITERLVLSPKTVDHHVSAILRKLGVPDREAACHEADWLGLQVGGSVAPK